MPLDGPLGRRENLDPGQDAPVEPIEGEGDNLYGPSLLQWQGRNLLVYQDGTAWRGGNLKCVELDPELHAVGAGGTRHVLIDPPAGPPMKDRYRGAEFYAEGEKLYLYSSGSKDPRILVYATARIGTERPQR